ncbi:MAG: hypothetical protein JNL79_17860 [Myxococcales bacterium]|nr:hypothetical protein [Myxococcales bacterium]
MSPARLIPLLLLGACGGRETTLVEDARPEVTVDAAVVVDTSTRPDVVVVDSSVPPPSEKPFGKACTSDSDCDVTGSGLGHCTNRVYRLTPLNPTSICIDVDLGGGDACDPGDGTSVALCEGDLGLCTRAGSDPSLCQQLCTVDDRGLMTTACVGKNACNPYAIGKDFAGKSLLFGYCQGGCATDADCPGPAVCDPIRNLCLAHPCTTDLDCTKFFADAVAPGFACVADVAGGKKHCRFSFAKKDGDRCTPDASPNLPSKDCLCLGTLGGAVDTGVCATACKTVGFGATNAECPAGFVCDLHLEPARFDASFKLPAGMAGRCVRACTADTDCGAVGWTCTQSAGTPSKTCHPPV